VADARTLIEIVWDLPGRAATEFRRKSATTVCRVLGGDVSLVEEIEARHAALQETTEGRATQHFLKATPAESTAVVTATEATATAVATRDPYEGMPQGLCLLEMEEQRCIVREMIAVTMAERKKVGEEEARQRECDQAKYYLATLRELNILDPNIESSLNDRARNAAVPSRLALTHLLHRDRDDVARGGRIKMCSRMQYVSL
jgi:hypothetical protein